MSSTQFRVDLQLEILCDAISGPNNEENPTEQIDVVAVPGIGLAAKDPWTCGEVNWLKDDTMLRYWLPNARIMHASYDWEGFTLDRPIQHLLPLLARELVRATTAKRRTCPKRPLIFIGHSLGGLIVKQAALLSELPHEEYQLLKKSLVGIALFGTPHRATSLTSSEAVSLDTSPDDPRSVVQKEPSSFITLSWDFARVAIVHHIPVSCFFEQPVEGKALVDEQFSTIPGFENIALTTDHFHLCKYADPDDYNYKLVRDALIDFVQGSTNCLARRKDLSSEKINASLRALLATDPADDVDKIEHNKGPLLQGSGSWLQVDPNFNEWLTCKNGRVFWLHGNHGKGKTMLSLSVLKDITEEIKSSGSGPSVLVTEFFCDNKDNGRNNLVAVLRSLVCQLLQSRPDLSAYFKGLLNSEGEQLLRSTTALPSLWRILRDFFAIPSVHRVYIIIDGLDELDEESIGELLKYLDPYLDPEQFGGKDQPRSEVKWFLSSRNISTITETLKQTLSASLEENANQVQNAVSDFIDTRVDYLKEVKGYNTGLASLVSNKLKEMSEGTFLYVSMVCDALARPNIRLFDTDQVLQTLPKGLGPLYDRILQQTRTGPKNHVQYATRILKTMVLALRPLSLQELGLLAQLPEDHHHDGNILLEYTALSGSFITVRQNTVHFVHESVKEYLLSIDDLFPFPLGEYQAQLARIFLKLFLERSSSGDEVDEEKFRVDEAKSILNYPRLFWINHARQAGSLLDWSQYLSTPFLRSSSSAQKQWLDIYWNPINADWLIRPEDFTPLHFAAYEGISSLIRQLVERGDDINAKDSTGYTPLMWAARNGFPDAVEQLLSLEADQKIRTSGGLTAVFLASINGNHRSLEKLVRKGGQVNIRDQSDCTPAYYAALNGQPKTLGILLDAGADIEAISSSRTPLQRASYSGEVSAVKVLLEHNADSKVQDKEGRTLLHLAVRSNQLDMLDFWLNNSNNLETQDRQSWTPLMHAASLGNNIAAVHLIKNGVNVKAKTREGHTALSLATLKGKTAIVNSLLDAGADPEVGSDTDETPLQQAAGLGNATICQLLLEAGADPNAQTSLMWTPLHQAASNGHQIAAKLLLQYGADPNAVDMDDRTPSALALENNHIALATYLKNREVIGSGQDLVIPIRTMQRDPLDPALCELLKISPECGYEEIHANEGFSRPSKVTALVNGKAIHYFVKSGPNEDMFASEHEALRELSETVPNLTPYSLGFGKYTNNDSRCFLLMEWLEMLGSNATTAEDSHVLSLPHKLAKLHSTPARTPPGYRDPQFGWHRSTYCGMTKQNNTFRASWDKFYRENRLLTVLHQIEDKHGSNEELRAAMEPITDIVVPRLLRNGNLGGRRGIQPVLIHGDLWHGNKAYGTNPAWENPEWVLFDPSSCYCHSEYEIGIMRCFGGFSATFYNEYHQLLPKTEPKHEYEDRIALYQLYHYLNHYLMFRGGAYMDSAMDIVKRLTDKYVSSED